VTWFQNMVALYLCLKGLTFVCGKQLGRRRTNSWRSCKNYTELQATAASRLPPNTSRVLHFSPESVRVFHLPSNTNCNLHFPSNPTPVSRRRDSSALLSSLWRLHSLCRRNHFCASITAASLLLLLFSLPRTQSRNTLCTPFLCSLFCAQTTMQRYSVVISDTGWPEPLKLLVPFQSSATSAALVVEVVKRASRFAKTLNTANYTLHLASTDGPLLDPDDILSDLVVDEQLFAVFDSNHAGNLPQVSQCAFFYLVLR
jgi:hypothetical protein